MKIFNFKCGDIITRHQPIKVKFGRDYSVIGKKYKFVEIVNSTVHLVIPSIYNEDKFDHIHIPLPLCDDEGWDYYVEPATDEQIKNCLYNSEPISISTLKRDLEKALEEERYELACAIRDQIADLET